MEVSNFTAISLKPPPYRGSILTSGSIYCTRERSSLRLSNLELDCSRQRVSKPFLGCRNLSLQNRVLVCRPRQASHAHVLKPCQAKREDLEGSLSGESIILIEQTWERELETAINEENYAEAAKIRDNLRLLQENSKASVVAANARFYNSFRNGDLAAMQSLWSKGDHVCVVHPGVSGISGYDLIMGSWEFVWADYEFPLDIEIKDAQVHVRDNMGYVTCIEMIKTKGGGWGRHFVTNTFERIDGQWFICIHHASYMDL